MWKYEEKINRENLIKSDKDMKAFLSMYKDL